MLRSWRESLLALTVATLATVAAESPVRAQDWYFVNGKPVTRDVAQTMAANGLGFGYYWLAPNGNWGVVGNSDPIGNIHRHLGLSERRRLYRPGEILGGD